MKIKIIAIGKLKDDYLAAAVEDYAKRLSRYAKLELIESPDFPNREGEEEKTMDREYEKAARFISPSDYLVLLDPNGKELTSHELPPFLEDASIRGKGSVSFLIGGSLGLSKKAQARGNAKLSLSRLTFTHGLARILLLEQIYRAFKIMRGEPYDK